MKNSIYILIMALTTLAMSCTHEANSKQQSTSQLNFDSVEIIKDTLECFSQFYWESIPTDSLSKFYIYPSGNETKILGRSYRRILLKNEIISLSRCSQTDLEGNSECFIQLNILEITKDLLRIEMISDSDHLIKPGTIITFKNDRIPKNEPMAIDNLSCSWRTERFDGKGFNIELDTSKIKLSFRYLNNNGSVKEDQFEHKTPEAYVSQIEKIIPYLDFNAISIQDCNDKFSSEFSKEFQLIIEYNNGKEITIDGIDCNQHPRLNELFLAVGKYPKKGALESLFTLPFDMLGVDYVGKDEFRKNNLSFKSKKFELQERFPAPAAVEEIEMDSEDKLFEDESLITK